MPSIVYGFVSKGDGNTTVVKLPNGKVLEIHAEDVEMTATASSGEEGLMAVHVKSDAKVVIRTTLDDPIVGVFANAALSSFPKYYDDDGGTIRKSHDEPLRIPPARRGPDPLLVETGAPKHIEDTAYWPGW